MSMPNAARTSQFFKITLGESYSGVASVSTYFFHISENIDGHRSATYFLGANLFFGDSMVTVERAWDGHTSGFHPHVNKLHCT